MTELSEVLTPDKLAGYILSLNDPTEAEVSIVWFIAEKHRNHKRKYTGEPYITHLINVANIVKETSLDPYASIAALLHDTIEDGMATENEVKNALLKAQYTEVEASYIMLIVDDLTEKYTMNLYPELNRAKRKELEAQRLATASMTAQTIKYADIIDNGISIHQHDKKFFATYLREIKYLLEVMNKGDKYLRAKAINIIYNLN